MNASSTPNVEATNVLQAAETIRCWCSQVPDIAIVLGSGLGGRLEELDEAVVLPYAEIPGFPLPTVPGHSGQWIRARIGDTRVLLLAGRLHYYEGYSMRTVAYPVEVLAALKVSRILLTNAAGSLSPSHTPGSFMVIQDHINFMGDSPLRGMKDGGGFLDLTCLYSEHMRKALLESAHIESIEANEGIYVAVSGPNYETPAEIQAFRRLGAHAVGMSTVPEAIMAHYHGIEVAALSCLTNWAAGLSSHPPNHDDVLKGTEGASRSLMRLIRSFLERI